MSVPVIGATAAASAAPSAPGAVPAQGVLPFMLLPLAAVSQAEPSLGETPAPAETDEVLADDPDAPLIGWLFSSFALAATPPTPGAASTPDMPIGDAPLPAAVPQPRVAKTADIVAAVVAEQTAETVPPPQQSVTETLAPLQMALPEAGVEIPSSSMPADPLVAATGSSNPAIASLSPLPTISALTPATAPAPVDGAMAPLVADGPELAAELGERIAWQLDQGLGEATIELHPAELGALTIRIETQAQQAQVHILAAEPAARALLAQCLPQLRDMLGANGLTLTRSQVEAAERRSEAGVSDPTPRASRRRVTSVSLVDAYA